MADYHTQFSCIFDVGSAGNAARARDIYDELAERLEDDESSCIGFEMQGDPDSGSGALWVHSDDGNGDPEHVIAFVKLCAEAFDLQGRWGFWWGLSCSKPRLDGFGGGGHVIDLRRRETLAWVDCEHWVAEQLVADPLPEGAPA